MPIPNRTTINSVSIEESVFRPIALTHVAISPFAITATTPTSTIGSTATMGLRKMSSRSRRITTIVPTATIVFAFPEASRWSRACATAPVVPSTRPVPAVALTRPCLSALVAARSVSRFPIVSWGISTLTVWTSLLDEGATTTRR